MKTSTTSMTKKKIFAIFLFLGLSAPVLAQTPNATITALFQNSYRLYKDIRKSNGVYIDALTVGVASDKPAAIAANGIGLISLCISDAMYQQTFDNVNWEANAAGLAEATLQKFIDFKNAGKVNTAGMYHRYFDYTNGDLASGGWSGEYSTIDNAIFAMGVIFCKNYFSSNASICSKANTILNGINFTPAIGSNQIYMVLNQYGTGSAPTSPYNEYMLVAWLAKNASTANPNYTASQNFWNTYFANPLTAPSPVTRKNYWGYETLSDGNHWLSSFIPQFCYYLCNYYKNNTDYSNYFTAAMNSDKLYCQKAGFGSGVWGCGAGEIPGGGYSADAVENNPNKIVSPHIVAGFLPVYSQGKNDLLTLYNGGTGSSVYSLVSDPSKKVLWRYKLNNTSQRASYIQAIDFSTMLFGLASLPEYLGSSWFNTYNAIGAGSFLRPVGIPSVDSGNPGIGNIVYDPNSATMRVDHFEGAKQIDIYSIDGRKLQALSSSESSVAIDMAAYVSGGTVLIVTVTGSDGSAVRKKIAVY